MNIELTEYQPKHLERRTLPHELGVLLWKEYSEQVDVELPSFKTDDQWALKPSGWVGHIPLSPDVEISIQPKVPLHRLFEMLEVAYRLQSFRFLRGLTDCSSVPEFYDRLASILASRTLDRGRKGYHREYVGRNRLLQHVSGRLDVGVVAQTPWRVGLPCSFEEHTGDIADNQILLWTFSRIQRSSACTSATLRRASQAHRELQGVAIEVAVSASDCTGRNYSRLNSDYEPLHALCRFFLEQVGPSHEVGDRRMLPFLVDMARLFELFVAEWMVSRIGEQWELQAQETVVIDSDVDSKFVIDLVIRDRALDRTVCVADTKYKTPSHPSTSDIQQIVAYAVSQGCSEAILIYPCELEHPLDRFVGDIHVRSLVFDLDADLDEAGTALMQAMGLADGQDGRGGRQRRGHSAMLIARDRRRNRAT